MTYDIIGQKALDLINDRLFKCDEAGPGAPGENFFTESF